MHIEITITALGDRDPSCNLYTLTETHTFRISQTPTDDDIRKLITDHKAKFTATWPHRGTRNPTLIPIDVDVKTVEA